MWLITQPGLIIHKLGHRKGHSHDYEVYKKNHPVTPKQVVVNVFDLGYPGIKKDFPEQISSLPYKRIVIGHTICRIKKYRIMMMYLETN
ncbi:MAG: hypothetical protein ABJB76_10240 [Candidatus Nitrosocosmicus sp.]